VSPWSSAVAALAFAGLAGCASLPPPAGTLSGRLAVKVDAHGSEAQRSVSANFDLRGDARNGELSLTTPLGTTLAHARWQPGEVVLNTSQGESHHGDLGALAEATFGERIPLDALFDWLHGKPWSGAASQPLVAQRGFEQLGWTIDLARYDEGWVVASRRAPPAVTVRAKLDLPS
jgi:outer membrane lipoprotein LolB